MRGGLWAASKPGLVFDSVRAQALGADWRAGMMLNTTATSAVAKCSEEGAKVLADFWAPKHEYLHQLWLDHNEDPA